MTRAKIIDKYKERHKIEVKYSNIGRELIVKVTEGEYGSEFSTRRVSVSSRIPFVSMPIDRVIRKAQSIESQLIQEIRSHAADEKIEELGEDNH